MAEVRTPLTIDQLLAKLQKTKEWWYRNHRNLKEKHGFPPTLPGMGRCWDPAAIEAWQTSQIPAHLRPAATPTASTSFRFEDDEEIREAQRRMDARAQNMASADQRGAA